MIAETERDAHRISFNEAFKSKGIQAEWSVEEYGELLKIGGGKERMTSYFDNKGWPASIPEAERSSVIADLHKLKTNLFQGVIESGVVPLRPGVQRLIDEAFANGLPVAVCSTSNEQAVTTIVRKLLGEERLSKMPIFAGDMVAKKKPSPDIYLLAANSLKVDPSKAWVVEDSHIGLQAAKAAGMRCVVTKSIYTMEEDFGAADIVVDNLDAGLDGPITVAYLNYKASSRVFKPQSTTENADMFASTPNLKDMFSKIAKGDMGKKGMPF